jgi:hypothetical protein
MYHVNYQKQKNECSQYSHRPGIPLGCFVTCSNSITGSPGGPVLQFKLIPLKNMQQKACKKPDFSYTNQKIGPHKVSSLVEIHFRMFKENICIDITMHNKKNNKENTCKGHDNFLANGRAKQLSPVHKFKDFSF